MQQAAEDALEAKDVSQGMPQFEVDPFWPKPLPNNWIIGQVSGVAVDSNDHIWILHRPGSLDADEVAAIQDPPLAICCRPAPPVIELDGEGNLIQAWGGPGEDYDWPESEHGIYVDNKDRVWIAGSGPEDHQVLAFKRDGTFVRQIGKAGQTAGSNDENLLGRPTDITVDPEANEVYITDGYLNRRVVVFDADTGEYKRHWGAYGKKPDDSPVDAYDPSAAPSQQFRSPVHAVVISKDGLVHIADRANDRIQVFKKDGTFVKEVVIAKETLGPGSSWDMDFSHDAEQKFLYVPDGTNQQVWILGRKDLEVLGSFGRSGRNAGQFHWVHNLAVDSKGNIYTGEVQTGKRAQRFVLSSESK
jgi:DNA-binding beta-propeller fold protein YncE